LSYTWISSSLALGSSKGLFLFLGGFASRAWIKWSFIRLYSLQGASAGVLAAILIAVLIQEQSVQGIVFRVCDVIYRFDQA
jgi:hypothetical protein